MIDYEYNSLSQLLSETRDFTDTLVDAPISGGKFKLEYSYALSGQLKSLKDPYGQQFNYGHDKAGRLQTVTGSTAFNGITDYASDPSYNARGNLTGLSYGNGTTMSVTGFNARLQATGFEVKKGTTGLIEKEYEFYSDGSLKFIDDGMDQTFDRLYKYNQAGRTIEAKAGTAARGETPTGPHNFDQPYTREYTHDAFGHITEMDGAYYGTSDTTNYSYTNNRNPNWLYDFAGNMTADDDASYSFDAAGRIVSTYEYEFDETPTASYFDGDGRMVKRTRNEGATTADEQTNYYVFSSVLSKLVSEVGDTGKKLKTFVPANGTTLAEQLIVTISGTPTEKLRFIHTDASGGSLQQTTATGNLVVTRAGEYDAMGRNVADISPYITLNSDPPESESGSAGLDLTGTSQGYRPAARVYRIDGQVVPASRFMDEINSGQIGGSFGLIEMSARMSVPRFAGYSLRFGNGDIQFAGYDYDGAISQMEGGETLIRNWYVNDSWAVGSLISSGQRQTQEGTFRKGKKGLQQAPPIDDDKFKTCLSDLFFISSVESYDPGKSFAGRVKDDSWIALLAILFGGENPPTKRITVTTTAVSSSMLSFLKNGTFGTPGVLGGYTPSDDFLTKYWRGETPDRNYITNDFGSAKFQESMWVYELGNSLGWQTGHTPEAINEENRYGDRRERNDKGGPALMDCVYGGKVGSRGEIESTPN